MSAARRVFVHIGLPKTGTTYLQNAIWENKAELGRRGVLVPGRHRRRHLLATLDIRGDPKLSRRPGDVSAPWQDLVDEVDGWDGDAVISHEFFGAAPRAGIRRVRDSFPDRELHVIVTARSMVDLGISRWQEWVKNGGQRGLDEYPPPHHRTATDEWGWRSFDLADVLRRWGRAFPHARIHVLPMRPGSDAEGLWGRFLGVLGVDPSGLAASQQPSNTTLGLVEIELLRRVNSHLELRTAMARGHWVRGYLGEGHVLRRTGERVRPAPETLAELERRGERALEMVRAGGFDVVGDIELLRASDLDGLREPDDVSSEEILDSATYTIARLVEDVRSLTDKRKELAQELATMRSQQGLRANLSRFVRRVNVRDSGKSAQGGT